MIELFEAGNYGCLHDVSVKLTPLHAFIGPNDSGKSTLLGAVRMLGNAIDPAGVRGDTSLLLHDGVRLRATARSGSVEVRPQQRQGLLVIRWQGGSKPIETQRQIHAGYGAFKNWQGDLVDELRSEMVRFDPAALRQHSKLIPEGKRVAFFDERGRGLPGIYQAILGRGDEAFSSIRDSVRRLFPTVKNLRVVPVSETELLLETELADGTRVRPGAMSDGLLYFLGFAAISYLAPIGILLIEEPENGLHPARIRDVLTLLREFVKSSGTQVLMATHSPLVVNELKPDEVSVVTRDAERGTQIRLIKDTPHFERRARVAELGEMWLSYADGVQEAPLLGDKHAAS